MSKRTLFGISTLILMVVIGIGIWSIPKFRQKPIEPLKKVTLGISKSFLSIPVYIAQEQGYFAYEGLDITIQEYPSGKLATQAMLAGEMDISTVADMPIVYNSFAGEDFCIFATFSRSTTSPKVPLCHKNIVSLM